MLSDERIEIDEFVSLVWREFAFLRTIREARRRTKRWSWDAKVAYVLPEFEISVTYDLRDNWPGIEFSRRVPSGDSDLEFVYNDGTVKLIMSLDRALELGATSSEAVKREFDGFKSPSFGDEGELWIRWSIKQRARVLRSTIDWLRENADWLFTEARRLYPDTALL